MLSTFANAYDETNVISTFVSEKVLGLCMQVSVLMLQKRFTT